MLEWMFTIEKWIIYKESMQRAVIYTDKSLQQLFLSVHGPTFLSIYIKP